MVIKEYSISSVKDSERPIKEHEIMVFNDAPKDMNEKEQNNGR